MKKCILFLLIATCNIITSQEYTYKEKSITGIFTLEGENKNSIYSKLNKWISLNYNSSKNVIQLNDKEAGNIIIKGVNTARYKNALKEIYPKNKYIKEFESLDFNHVIEIGIKDGKFRMIFTLTNIVSSTNQFSQGVTKDLVFSVVSLDGQNSEALNKYNFYLDDLWKKSMIGKKKRELYLKNTEPVFSELNKGVIQDIEKTMMSMFLSLSNNKDEDW